MKAAIYCRLSSEDDHLLPGDNSESIYNQQLILTEYAKAHNMDIYAVYTDDNYSGLDSRRPAFCRLIADARSGRFQIILCKNQSRFTRDMETAERYLNNLFPLWGIRFLGISDGADTKDSRNRKLRQINGLVNEWYCEDLSDSIRAVLQEKMRLGQYIGSFPCYGYTRDPDDRHRLIPDPPAARIVRRIFEAYLAGNSLKTIAGQLNLDHIPSPCAYKIQQGLLFQTPFCANDREHSPSWAPSSIRRILTNPVYLGILIQGRERKESFKSCRRIRLDDCHWHIIPGAHPALISRETFEEAARLLAARRRRKGSHPEIKKTP